MDRPYIIVNVAASIDGKIDTILRQGATISSKVDKSRVDRLRASVDAVLVGGHTLLSEDPALTVRSAEFQDERIHRGLPAQPAAVGIVSEIPDEFQLENFITRGGKKTYIFTTQRTPKRVIEQLETATVNVYVFTGQRVDIRKSFNILFQSGVRRMLVEGGGTIISELFHLELVDELMLYLAPFILGGETAPTMVDGKGFMNEKHPRLTLQTVERMDLEGGVFLHYKCNN